MNTTITFFDHIFLQIAHQMLKIPGFKDLLQSPLLEKIVIAYCLLQVAFAAIYVILYIFTKNNGNGNKDDRG